MKIAIINPSDEFEIGIKGGNQLIAEALAKNIERYTPHKVTKIFLPLKTYPNLSLLKSYLAYSLTDLSKFDIIISLKFPSFMIKHKNHICYFAHFYRQFYDLWSDFKNKTPSTYLTRFIIKSLDKKALSRTKKNYSYSKFIQSRLEEQGIKSELLYSPPIEENFRSENYDYILSTSILNDERKRISLLIKSMKNIKENIKLIIVGDGPHKDYLKELAKDDKRIIFLGYKSPRQLLKLYANALCTCIVSYKEDYGLVTIESMKSKKPVVTCVDSGGPLEFVEHKKTGLIAQPNPESISKQLSFLIKNKQKAKIMGENAFEKVKDINWRNVIDKIINENSNEI